MIQRTVGVVAEDDRVIRDVLNGSGDEDLAVALHGDGACLIVDAGEVGEDSSVAAERGVQFDGAQAKPNFERMKVKGRPAHGMRASYRSPRYANAAM